VTEEQAEDIAGSLLGSGRLTDMEEEALSILLGYADAEPDQTSEPRSSQ
jgi:hypothetical protein